jgi:hypothetical protein
MNLKHVHIYVTVDVEVVYTETDSNADTRWKKTGSGILDPGSGINISDYKHQKLVLTINQAIVPYHTEPLNV